ncbi:AraC-like DNA-binding protein [Lachnotalea glycerini]|uniref:AraC-like DNA-binding protein n=1 Tax=Lachnotalea glycerini TaxID=1763509 RepID=A0A318ETU1_9FIRM|nr:helix-turn-helix domain-containing protein [Lachnotalea glycerini]PXV93329.1 AraC-like DNA-binding protein [Lachnotalea glycerini]
MNIEYLMQYISYHLHTIVRTYSKDKLQQSISCVRTVSQDDLLFSQSEIENFILDIPPNEFPLLSSINDNVVFATVTTPQNLFIIGPLYLNTPVYIKHQLSVTSFDPSYLQPVFSCEFSMLVEDMLLIHNLFRTYPLDRQELIRFNCIEKMIDKKIQKNFNELLFQSHETGQKHNPYDQEIREFSSIENGSMEQLEKSWAEDYIGNIGTLANNKLRSLKNLCIVVITLASRAAIRGGVNPEISFSLSDIYIRKVEEAQDEVTLNHLSKDAEYKYTMMVHEIKEYQDGFYKKDKNPRIGKCKDYIYTHLHEKIFAKNIADELDMNSKYLSDLFKQCEGISISDFILKEKINLTKNLLVYSNYTYIEIATYLGFSSQSHLGKQFKKITKMTLKQYRDCFGVKEFI